MRALEVMAVALILLALFDWLATGILIRAARRVREPALTERAITSLVLTGGATGVAVVAFLFLIHLDLDQRLLFLLVGVVALSIPQIVWVVAYKLGRFQ